MISPLGGNSSARELAQRVTMLEESMKWMKETLGKIEVRIDRIEQRMWWILGSVVVLGIIAILVALL